MNRYLNLVFSLAMLSCCTKAIFADELARRAQWQARLSALPEAGVRVMDLAPNTPLYIAGVRKDDVIIGLNNQAILGAVAWNDLTDSLVADTEYHIQYRRDQQLFDARVQFPAVVKESYDNIDVHYGSVISDYGIRQRTIVTRPKATEGQLAAIFVVGGLSCSSIEYWPGRKSKFIRSLQNIIANSGMLVMRLEKPGLGDSEGNCSQTDFKTELNGIETALKTLLNLPQVDASRVIVYGSSMGSAIAPYLVNKYQLNGLIADGTFYRSWFEHMLEIERRIKTMQGLSQSEINKKIVQAYIPLYYGMLIEKKSYGELIAENALLSDFNYHGSEYMYGRPVAYYHQVQDFNFAGEWSKVAVPVRIRWGTNDWIMSEADNDMIVDALAAAGNDNVTLVKYPGLDHWDAIHKNAKDSFQGKAGQWDQSASDLLVDWAKELNQTAWRD